MTMTSDPTMWRTATCALPEAQAASIVSVPPPIGDVGRRNEAMRIRWGEDALAAIPPGWRLLDAGAGECRYRSHCAHLRYVSQDVRRPDPADGDARIDIVSD